MIKFSKNLRHQFCGQDPPLFCRARFIEFPELVKILRGNFIADAAGQRELEDRAQGVFKVPSWRGLSKEALPA